MGEIVSISNFASYRKKCKRNWRILLEPTVLLIPRPVPATHREGRLDSCCVSWGGGG